MAKLDFCVAEGVYPKEATDRLESALEALVVKMDTENTISVEIDKDGDVRTNFGEGGTTDFDASIQIYGEAQAFLLSN
ncbi:MAG: hypothetical protein CMI56_01075 [Parcubacteria group bacterium]|nr:hypothetical protein [Parcubacteria group bacterium]|tara:strand:+ start:150 stop:383 length:234 start_codon:yes stop_codon:yes gene_type:complete